MASATFRIWRSAGGSTRSAGSSASSAGGDGGFQEYATETYEGMVVLDALLDIQSEQVPDLSIRCNCKAGKCGSCSA